MSIMRSKILLSMASPKRRLADMQAGASERVMLRQTKNPFDFVLWKSAKQTESSEKPNGSRLGVWVAQVGISNARR